MKASDSALARRGPLVILEEGRPCDDEAMLQGMDPRIASQMLEHFGWVYVQRGDEALHVCFNLATVTEEAMLGGATLLRWSERPGPVLFDFKFGGWRRECHRDALEAADRLERLIPFRTVHPFLGTTMRPGREDPADDPGLCGRVFRTLDRRADGDRTPLLKRLATDRLEARVVCFSLEEAKADLRYRFIGGRSDLVRFFGRSWSQMALGTRYDLDPADGYADRVCEPYLQVMDTGAPRLDEIQALVDVPGQEPLWVPYRRLLAKISDAQGRPGLLLVTQPIQDPLPLLSQPRAAKAEKQG